MVDTPIPTLAQTIRSAVEGAVIKARGNKKLAAKWLGISRNTLYRHLEQGEKVNHELPTIVEMAGIVPDFTGGLTMQEFCDEVGE